MTRIHVTVMASALATMLIGASAASAQTTLYAQGPAIGTPGVTGGGAYVPPGTLYDNQQADGTTSLVSQDSSGTFQARSADDFSIPAGACASGVFDISQVRVQTTQQNAAPQSFGLDLFNDDGSGTSPTAGINPFATFPQTSQTNLGAFGAATSLFEASFNTPGLQLNANTVYWVSGFGTDAAANAAGFNNYFAASTGATGTSANGVLIAPGAGVATWTEASAVIGPPSLAFSFAIDGTCATAGAPLEPPRELPTLSQYTLMLLGLLLGIAGVTTTLRRRREQ
ncbi:MAG TPA: hypothetical protein VFN25_02450 [Dokdonella sp.]|uniref:hypothetical protein n=1 Tax=Dokdonella sp. TaxID=2291710 RepID=UPI002D808791|nr:hypothetical protein [Dokdonella sp.]HET9031745.1 hypothetical protein [Dokdonella sp.]